MGYSGMRTILQYIQVNFHFHPTSGETVLILAQCLETIWTKVKVDLDVLQDCPHSTIAHDGVKKSRLGQGAFNCGPSSHPDFIKNYFLLKRMFRFFWHSRQMPYFNVSRQKVTHFNALGQKVTYLNEMR